VRRRDHVEFARASWSWHQPSATVCQKEVLKDRGSSGAVNAESCGVVEREMGLCFFHISMSGRALDFIIRGIGPGGWRGATVGESGAGGVIDIVLQL
jgi:hypothetical protein